MSCKHEGYHCSRVSYPWPYLVTRREPDGTITVVRWSDENDPPFPCLCACSSCSVWRDLKAQIDGPVTLPVA